MVQIERACILSQSLEYCATKLCAITASQSRLCISHYRETRSRVAEVTSPPPDDVKSPGAGRTQCSWRLNKLHLADSRGGDRRRPDGARPCAFERSTARAAEDQLTSGSEIERTDRLESRPARWVAAPVRMPGSSFKPNTHRRRRRDSSVSLSRIGGVYGIRNLSATVSTSLNKFANSEIVELRRFGGLNAPVGGRRELVANSVHAHRRRRRDTTRQLRRVSVGGVYWA